MTTAHTRARDLGIPFDGQTGPYSAITDVPGVQVGYQTLVSKSGPLVPGQGPVRTGVTAILPREIGPVPHPVFAALHRLNGNGEMTGSHWIEDSGTFMGPVCITNTHSVGMVHHAATNWMCETYSDHFVKDHGWAMPVVAETYDGLTNDIVGQHVTEADAHAAIGAAKSGPVAEGNVGGGAGMMTYEFKGGSGTTSRLIEIDNENFVVGAFVQSNFGLRSELSIRGVRVGKLMPENAPLTELAYPETGSIIVVLATNAPLLPHQLKRLAKRGALGIGRTGSHGGHYSGDIVLAFSTGNDHPATPSSGFHPVRQSLVALDEHYLDQIYAAAVDSVEEAIINAMVAAETVPIVKPAGYDLRSIDHNALREIFAKVPQHEGR